MAVAETVHEDSSKRDRILNALSVYPKRYRMSNQVIADLTDASASYVYQLRTAMDEGEISDEEAEAALDDELQSQYRDRIGDLLEEYDVARTVDEDAEQEEETPEEQEGVEDTSEEVRAESEKIVSGGDGEEAASVSIEEVRRVRDVMAGYRADAEFEREHFQGEGKTIAEAKYYISNRAVEMLDQLIEG